MNIYPEIKKIAEAIQKVKHLSKIIADKIDTKGLDFTAAYLIDGCKEKDGHLYRNGIRLDNGGLVDDDCYCEQYTGYLEDDFYGVVYFKTNVPCQFVAVPF